MPPQAVRVVVTNTLRTAFNAAGFLRAAEEALGHPIDVIAGAEVAHLIYLGMAHSLPPSSERRLVVDIGGGSTEPIGGEGLQPLNIDSQQMGCVFLHLPIFSGRKIQPKTLERRRSCGPGGIGTDCRRVIDAAMTSAVRR